MGDSARVEVPAAWAILANYYAFRLQYAGIRLPIRTPRKALAYAERYLIWAKAEQIDPRLFMRHAFEIFARARPGSSPSIVGMRAKKLLVAWRERYEGAALAQESFRDRKRVVRSKIEREVSRLRAKPTKAQEAARSDYAGMHRYSLCMLDESTGGYDPRSRLCPGCPEKYACLLGTNRRHGFDVGALRVGLFARLPAEVAAAVKQ